MATTTAGIRPRRGLPHPESFHAGNPRWTETARHVLVPRGGGYSYGAGSLSEFDGNNLAHRGDVVVVSITHRLNILGHLDLAGIGGEEYADSANVGILDIRAALQWVRENIERFGGDSGNVLTFGQSGGGDKGALCAMPSAKGLFHKAAVQSGSTFQTLLHDASTKIAESLLMKVGLRANQLHDLQNLAYDRLLSATIAAPGERPLRFGPVVDGRILPGRPFDPTAPEASAEVPMIIGTTATEITYMIGAMDPAVFHLSEADMRMRLKKIAGDSSDGLIDLYRKNRPEGSPSDIFFAITTDRQMRRSAILQAERKAGVGKASAYMYLMAWKTPAEDGKWRSPHTVEVPFVWDNVNESASLVGRCPELGSLADKMSGAWLAFAHTGSPSTPGLRWPSYTASQRATMIFDNRCEVVNDPDKKERLAIEMSTAPLVRNGLSRLECPAREQHFYARRCSPVNSYYRNVWSAVKLQTKNRDDGFGLRQCIRPLVESKTPGHDGFLPALFLFSQTVPLCHLKSPPADMAGP